MIKTTLILAALIITGSLFGQTKLSKIVYYDFVGTKVKSAAIGTNKDSYFMVGFDENDQFIFNSINETDLGVKLSRKFNLKKSQGANYSATIASTNSDHIYVAAKLVTEATAVQLVAMKINSSGEVQWATELGPVDEVEPISIMALNGTISLVASEGNFTKVIKLNDAGSLQWAKKIHLATSNLHVLKAGKAALTSKDEVVFPTNLNGQPDRLGLTVLDGSGNLDTAVYIKTQITGTIHPKSAIVENGNGFFLTYNFELGPQDYREGYIRLHDDFTFNKLRGNLSTWNRLNSSSHFPTNSGFIGINSEYCINKPSKINIYEMDEKLDYKWVRNFGSCEANYLSDGVSVLNKFGEYLISGYNDFNPYLIKYESTLNDCELDTSDAVTEEVEFSVQVKDLSEDSFYNYTVEDYSITLNDITSDVIIQKLLAKDSVTCGSTILSNQLEDPTEYFVLHQNYNGYSLDISSELEDPYVKMELISLNGQVVVSEKINRGTSNHNLQTNHLSNGIYMIRISGLEAHIVFSKKLLIH